MSDFHKKVPIVPILKIILLPVIIYGVFFVIRLMGLQPKTETGMGDFITALFFIYGASVVYLTFFLKCMNVFPENRSGENWWWFSVSFFLMYLAYDEIFMIHENIGRLIVIREVYIFLFYALILILLIYFYRQKVTPSFRFFLVCFICLSGIAVISDTFLGEGLINIFGREIDFEQLAESLSALCLASAFTSATINELKQHISINHKTSHPAQESTREPIP